MWALHAHRSPSWWWWWWFLANTTNWPITSGNSGGRRMCAVQLASLHLEVNGVNASSATYSPVQSSLQSPSPTLPSDYQQLHHPLLIFSICAHRHTNTCRFGGVFTLPFFSVKKLLFSKVWALTVCGCAVIRFFPCRYYSSASAVFLSLCHQPPGS